jgi:hypothetical protein
MRFMAASASKSRVDLSPYAFRSFPGLRFAYWIGQSTRPVRSALTRPIDDLVFERTSPAAKAALESLLPQ